MKRGLRLTAFLALVVGGGLLIGFVTAPGDWYRSLAKPSFNPPGWLFAPVWTLLYVLIAIAGWRTWERRRSSRAMMVWWLQLALNFAWTPLFFAAHLLAAALVDIALLLCAISCFIVIAWRSDRTAALLFVPYACWVGFATALNAAIVKLN